MNERDAELADFRSLIRDRLDALWPQLRVVDVRLRPDEDGYGEPVLMVDLIFRGGAPNVDAVMDAERHLHAQIFGASDAFPVFSFIDEKEASALRRGAR